MKVFMLCLVLLVNSCSFLYQPIDIEEISDPLEVNAKVPQFQEVDLNFKHRVTEEIGYPFLGSALIDMDGDGVDEVFLGGGPGQSDGLFRFDPATKKFIDISAQSGITNTSLTYGVLAIDMNQDGKSDLLVSRDDGIYFYENKKLRFKGQKLAIPLEKDSVAIGITACDVNLDGQVDLYLSTFISANKFKAATFNDPNHGKRNLLLINKGGYQFEDITEKSGLEIKQNTFSSLFVDLNGDGFQDMVAALNTGPVLIFKNDGKGHFKQIPTKLENGFWMGAAVGDIDNDGDQDLFFTNIGNTIPGYLLRGDLRDEQELNLQWLLLRNDGGFKFTDITEDQGLFNGEFAWGTAFEDFNLDGKIDLLVSENLLDWPAHGYSKAPHRLFINDGHKFKAVTKLAGVENKFYGQTPLVSDFNSDGYPDFIWVNINDRSRAFLNKGGKNQFLKVQLPNNASSLGAKVRVKRADGVLLNKVFTTGVGYMSDQTHTLFFGLGPSRSIPFLEIKWPDGFKKTYPVKQVNTLVQIKK